MRAAVLVALIGRALAAVEGSPSLKPVNLDTVQYGAFTQTATFSVAQQLGFFTANRLHVVFQQVPNSTAAYAGVLDGTYDILTGTIDNVVNLRLNQGQNLTVVGQLDAGPDLVLASTPSITSIDQLRGQPLIVDSPLSGFSFILRKILSLYGMNLDNGDFSFQTVGGTNLRFADLIQGSLPNGSSVHATILTYPFTAQGSVAPTNQRPNILARASDFVQPLTSSAFTIQQDTLSNDTRKDIVTRFVSAMYAANKFLLDPSQRSCSTFAIQKQLNASHDLAKLQYQAVTNPLSGEVSPGNNFTVDRQGILNVIDIRQQFGGFSVPDGFNFIDAITPGTGKMVDYSIRDAALEQLPRFSPNEQGIC